MADEIRTDIGSSPVCDNNVRRENFGGLNINIIELQN